MRVALCRRLASAVLLLAAVGALAFLAPSHLGAASADASGSVARAAPSTRVVARNLALLRATAHGLALQPDGLHSATAQALRRAIARDVRQLAAHGQRAQPPASTTS